ncbi:hypothetical protein Tco_0345041 [Tanacetum coccineum]
METCDPVGTPMEIKDKLDLDQNGSPVDAMKYRSMIGALMYLTSSRPDILHATCLCAPYQAKPIEKHLKEVKRIFRYLRGTVNMSLWYTKDSGFELTKFLDADYAGCKDTFKSTSGGAQFLGKKLMTTSVGNNSAFRSFFKKQKLTGPNFIDSYRQLRLVLSTEDKENYLKHPIPAAPVAQPGQQVPPKALAAHAAWVKGQKEVVVLMLLTMDLDIQWNLAHLGAYDML